MTKIDVMNAVNAIDNLEGLAESLLAGEDYCSVSIVLGGVNAIKELLADAEDQRLKNTDYYAWVIKHSKNGERKEKK